MTLFFFLIPADEVEIEAKLIETCIDAVARGARNLGHDVAVLADESVDDARLTGVRTSHDGEAGNVVVHNLLGLLGQRSDHNIEQDARSATCGSADALGVAQSELVELGGLVGLTAVVDLVGHKDHGQLGAAKNGGHVLIPIGEARLHIHEEEHEVGLLGSHLHLFADGTFEDVVGLHYPSAGIDDGELLSVPLALAVLAVARGTGCVTDDGLAALRQTVEKRGLAHIGPSNYRY